MRGFVGLVKNKDGSLTALAPSNQVIRENGSHINRSGYKGADGRAPLRKKGNMNSRKHNDHYTSPDYGLNKNPSHIAWKKEHGR